MLVRSTAEICGFGSERERRRVAVEEQKKPSSERAFGAGDGAGAPRVDARRLPQREAEGFGGSGDEVRRGRSPRGRGRDGALASVHVQRHSRGAREAREDL